MSTTGRTPPGDNRRPSDQEPQRPQGPTFQQLLKANEEQIALALPKHLTAERMIRVAITAFNRTPELAKCEVYSVCGAIIQASQLGLEPDGVLGHAYLVPFWNKKTSRLECQLIPGYKGLLDLARRSGRVTSVNANLVHAGDEWNFSLGLDETLTHRPLLTRKKGGLWVMVSAEERGEPVLAYATALMREAGHAIEVMAMPEIIKIRDKSSQSGYEGFDKDGDVHHPKGPWKDYPDWMARKTVLKQLLKLLPLSIEVQTAVALTDRNEAGLSQELDGMFTLPTERGPLPNGTIINVRREPEPERDRDAAARYEAGLDEVGKDKPDTKPEIKLEPEKKKTDGKPGLSIEDFNTEEFSYLSTSMRRLKGYNRAQLSQWLGGYDGDKQKCLGEVNILIGELETKGAQQ